MGMSQKVQEAGGQEERTDELREIRERLQAQQGSYAPPLLTRIWLLLAALVTIGIVAELVRVAGG
jgi:hypothetical protein